MKASANKVKYSIPESLASSHEGKPDDSQDGDIPVPHFKRRKHESEKAYLQRMETEAKHVLFLTENQEERKPELAADHGKSENKKE